MFPLHALDLEGVSNLVLYSHARDVGFISHQCDGFDHFIRHELKRRLNGARDGLKTLLIAWARYEDELPEGSRRQAAQNARDDWGRVARGFLTIED